MTGITNKTFNHKFVFSFDLTIDLCRVCYSKPYSEKQTIMLQPRLMVIRVFMFEPLAICRHVAQ